MTGTRLAIVFSLAAGIAGAAQASVSGALGRRRVDRRLGASTTLAVARWRVRRDDVLAIAYAPPRIGTFATVALLIAGQLAAGALIDANGWLGSPRIPVTLARVAGLVLVTAGAALTLKR
jgi:uncharacterized membrane protein YdcZ (DUF606 family)